jgi:hypothetical protein
MLYVAIKFDYKMSQMLVLPFLAFFFWPLFKNFFGVTTLPACRVMSSSPYIPLVYDDI